MKEIAKYKYKGNDGNWDVKIDRVEVTDVVKDKFKNQAIVKAIVFDNTYKNFSYDRRIISMKSLRHTYHGQTYIIYPFLIHRADKGYEVQLKTDSNACNGCFVVSKRDLKERYPQLKRASAIEVKKAADNQLKTYVREYSSLLAGGYNEVAVEYNGNQYHFNVIGCNSEEIAEKVSIKIGSKNDNFVNVLNSAISSSDSSDLLDEQILLI